MTFYGLNEARVAALHAPMRGYTERGESPGIVALVVRGDDVRVAARGTMTAGETAPVRRDAIFRVASITKPITAAATMILVDDGKLRLDDTVDRWLPEPANRQVLRRIDARLDDTVPARRAITVRDLPTFCFGFGSVMAAARDAVDIRAAKPWNVPGRFGWDRDFGTSAYSDPRNDLVGILLTQRLLDSPEPPAVFGDFWAPAYRSLAG